MYCLVLEGVGNAQTVQLAKTLSPAAAVNLELLSTALQVRRSTGTEAMFSLEPESPAGKNRQSQMQLKCFQPEWLASTKVGELLFQADYYLKELCISACSQP
eukprot:490267-Amphidinium_carterae.1